jgi:uncharacterized RDD family membrane protein YckC
MSSLPAGWYKDPADTSTQRYWDGEGWLGKAIPADAVPPDGPPPVEEEPPAPPLSAPISGQPMGGRPPIAGQQPPPGQAPPGQVPPGQVPPGQAPPGWGTPGWGTPPGQTPTGWGTPPGQTPTGWGTPPGQTPAGWGTPSGQIPPGQVPPPGWPPPVYGQMPPPGWAPPPGWQPPPGMRMGAFPFGVQARPHGYALAGLGRRLVARLIDIAAVLLLNVVVNGYFAYQWGREFAPIYRDTVNQMANGGSAFDAQPSSRMDALLWIMLIVATLVWLAYEAPALAGSGQTLGKRVMRIKVLPVESTGPLGFARAFRRWMRLGIWTLAWGCLGFGLLVQFIDALSPTFDPLLRQAFHDKVAGTVVVELPPDGAPPVDVPTGAGSSSSPSSPEGRS